MSANKTLIIDFGSHTLRCGRGSDEVPSQVFRSTFDSRQTKFGSDSSPSFILKGRSPDLGQLLTLIEQVMKNDKKGEEFETIFFVLSPSVSYYNAETYFDLINYHNLFKDFYYAKTSSMICKYDYNIDIGLVVELGYDCSNIVPVYEGYSFHDFATKNFAVTGQSLNLYLIHLLKSNGYDINDKKDSHISKINEIREKLCYVANSNEESAVAPKTTIKADFFDCEIDLGTEITSVPELLFEGNSTFGSYDALPDEVYRVITSCPIEYRDLLFQNIILCGGISDTKGLVNRFKSEFAKLVKPNEKFEVHHKENNINSAWKGAAILSRQEIFTEMKMLKNDFSDCFIGRTKYCFF